MPHLRSRGLREPRRKREKEANGQKDKKMHEEHGGTERLSVMHESFVHFFVAPVKWYIPCNVCINPVYHTDVSASLPPCVVSELPQRHIYSREG